MDCFPPQADTTDTGFPFFFFVCFSLTVLEHSRNFLYPYNLTGHTAASVFQIEEGGQEEGSLSLSWVDDNRWSDWGHVTLAGKEAE